MRHLLGRCFLRLGVSVPACRGICNLCTSGFSSSLAYGVCRPRGKAACPAIGAFRLASGNACHKPPLFLPQVITRRGKPLCTKTRGGHCSYQPQRGWGRPPGACCATGLEEHAVSPAGPAGNQGDTCAPSLSPAVTVLQGVLVIFPVCRFSQLSETHQRKGKGSKARGTCHARALEGEYSRDMLQSPWAPAGGPTCEPGFMFLSPAAEGDFLFWVFFSPSGVLSWASWNTRVILRADGDFLLSRISSLGMSVRKAE